MHFAGNKKRILEAEPDTPLVIKDQRLYASQEDKIPGFVSDSELRYSSHIVRACKQGINAVFALKRLINLRPEAKRQLYISKVALVVDYLSGI